MHKTLVVGLRSRGAAWARAVAEHPEFELAGIVDIDPETLAKRGAEFEVPEDARYTDHKAALGSGGYAACVVVVPHKLHYAITKDALEAGLHCLTEKPFTMDLAEAEELVALADSRARVVEVVQNYRYRASALHVAQAIREERLGRLANIEGRFHRYRPPNGPHETGMPFPVLFTQSVHHLDWLVSVLPAPIADVFARHQRVPWSKWANPSVCHVTLCCADGVLASYQASYESQGEISDYGGRWRCEFEKGDLIVEDDQRVWQVTDRGKTRECVLDNSKEARSGDLCLLDDLHEAIVNGTEPPTSGRDNLKTLKVLFEIMASWNATKV